MSNMEKVSKIMFDYESLSAQDMEALVDELNLKLVRWMAINHPDNRIRKLLLQRTNVSIGEDSVININIVISDDYKNLVYIGNRVAISPNVTIIAVSNPNNSRVKEISYIKEHLVKEAPVVIEDDVWIGTNVTILPDVVIGQGSIIGAGSIVTESIPPHSIAAGAPCRIIRSIDSDK